MVRLSGRGSFLVYDRNAFFYRNTETDRNRNFSTETEITETETKPNYFFTLIFSPLYKPYKNTLLSWEIFFQN